MIHIEQKIGRLYVIEEIEKRNNRRTWKCQCDCGRFKDVMQHHLLSGVTKSCGCLKVGSKIHGHTWSTPKKGASPTYKSWEGAKARCLNPNNGRYHVYGARGIQICDRWMKFENFLEDMGVKPSRAHQIHRRDNDGNYEKANCVWSIDHSED